MDEQATPFIIPTESDYERFLLKRIDAIRREAEEAIRPLVKELVRLESRRPPAPIFISKECIFITKAHAEALGFPRRD